METIYDSEVLLEEYKYLAQYTDTYLGRYCKDHKINMLDALISIEEAFNRTIKAASGDYKLIITSQGKTFTQYAITGYEDEIMLIFEIGNNTRNVFNLYAVNAQFLTYGKTAHYWAKFIEYTECMNRWINTVNYIYEDENDYE